MLLVLEIGMLILGLYAIIAGKFTLLLRLARARHSVGQGARRGLNAKLPRDDDDGRKQKKKKIASTIDFWVRDDKMLGVVHSRVRTIVPFAQARS